MALNTEGWVSPKPPEFECMKDQCAWYLKRFIKYCLWCARTAGLPNVPDPAMMDVKVAIVGDDYLIGELYDLFREYGDGFKERNIATISKVAAKYSSGDTVEDITSDMTLITTLLEKDKAVTGRLFSYLDQLRILTDYERQ